MPDGGVAGGSVFTFGSPAITKIQGDWVTRVNKTKFNVCGMTVTLKHHRNSALIGYSGELSIRNDAVLTMTWELRTLILVEMSESSCKWVCPGVGDTDLFCLGDCLRIVDSASNGGAFEEGAEVARERQPTHGQNAVGRSGHR